MDTLLTISMALFTLVSMCYLLSLIGDPLEKYGVRLGNLLRVPEAVIASTFAALATSGPEIIMAIQAIRFSEDSKACSGLLNMSFSAMDNLVGIGCLGMIYLLWINKAEKEEVIKLSNTSQVSLIFYIISSFCLSIFITLDYRISVIESWILMIIGIIFIISQFFLPGLINKDNSVTDEKDYLPDTTISYSIDILKNLVLYACCILGLWIFVRECLESTFTIASTGIVSIAGVLIMFTSYVSSFPEFMLTYQYAKSGKKDIMLAMLFGSNVIDLAFSGFKPIWTGKSMKIIAGSLLPLYIWLLPITAIVLLLSINRGKLKYKHTYFMMVGYLIYIVSGFVLL